MELEKINEVPQKKTIQVEIYPNGDVILPEKDAEGKYLRYSKQTGAEMDPVVKSFAPYIQAPPAQLDRLYKQACSNDDITISSWKDQWVTQTNANNAKYDFKKNTVMNVAYSEALKPVIIAGSGPSLKKNAHLLKPNWTKRIYPAPIGEKWELIGGKNDIKIVSCLHNFSFFEDLDIMTPQDFYVNLDAGDITIREVFEGGQHDEEWYWERTKDRTLVAYTATHPGLLKKWKGRILWYTTPPNPATLEPLKGVIDFSVIPPFNVGGNVLGSSLYMARAILGAGSVIFVGADFSFSRDRKFHSWDSWYDMKFTGIQSGTDIYGDRVYTWPSYYNFKCWFDYMACGGASNTQHMWINCTEGGMMGAYPEGNIQQIKQMTLKDCLNTLNMYHDLPEAMKFNSNNIPRLLF